MSRFTRKIVRWTLLFVCAGVLGLLANVASAAKVYLNFPPEVNAATRAQIKKVMQEEFNAAGADIQITDNAADASSAARTVNFHSGRSNPPNDRWGDSGDGRTVNVYVGEFTEPGVSGTFNTDTRLGNGLGETAAHEVGHTYGLSHNTDNPPSKMTEGGLVTPEQRAADSRLFTLKDESILTYATRVYSMNNTPTAKDRRTDLIAVVGQMPPLVPGNKHEDLAYLDATFTVGGPMASMFSLGHMATNDEGDSVFVLRSYLTGEFAYDRLTLFDGQAVQWAIQGLPNTPFAGDVFTLADSGQRELSDLLPSGLYQHAHLGWNLTKDSFFDVWFDLYAHGNFASPLNGFAAPVPTPSAFWMALALLPLMFARARSRRT